MQRETKPVVVVCGATGKQGGAVMEALLATNRFTIYALVRDHERSAHLASRGIKLRRGDYRQPQTLISAFSRADVVFGMTQALKPGARSGNLSSEVRQGKNIVDACEHVGVPLILSTRFHLGDGPTGIAHVDSKLEIEQYARAQRVDLVNVRPALFLDNIGGRWYPITRGRVRGPVDGHARLPYIAVRDIGRAVAEIIERLPDFVGRHVDLVAGMYSGDDIAAAVSRLRGGEPFRYVTHPRITMRLFFSEFYKMRLLLEKTAGSALPHEYAAAIAATKELIGNPCTLEDYLRAGGFATRTLRSSISTTRRL